MFFLGVLAVVVVHCSRLVPIVVVVHCDYLSLTVAVCSTLFLFGSHYYSVILFLFGLHFCSSTLYLFCSQCFSQFNSTLFSKTLLGYTRITMLHTVTM